MNENRGTTVLLTVIGIATLLVAVVGATFAFFTADVQDAEGAVDTDVTVTAANLGTITFTHGKTLTLGTTADPAFPGDSATNSFEVAADADSTVAVDYKVTLEYTNTFPANVDNAEVTNIQYKVWASSSSATGDLSSVAATENAAQWIDVKVGGTGVLDLGTVKLGTQGTVDTWNITIRLNETGKEQNDDQGKTFTGNLVVTPTTTYSADGQPYVAS